MQINGPYFLLAIVIRGSISAIFKEAYMSIILKKPMKLHRAKTNFFFVTIPSIILYIIIYLLRGFLADKNIAQEIEHHLTHFFITFMVVSRCLRALMKVLSKL